VLLALDRVIAARRGESPDRSYTSRLLAGGVEKAGGKVAEEAGEFVRAAAGETLARRFGTSGLVEKASRAAAVRVEGGEA